MPEAVLHDNRYSYVPLEPVRKATGIFLFGTVVSNALLLAIAVFLLHLRLQQNQYSAESDQLISLISMGLILIVLVYFGFLIGSFINVCIFMSRANANLRSTGTGGLRFGPALCVLSWIVPIANLFMPYMAMKEIYLCSANRRIQTGDP